MDSLCRLSKFAQCNEHVQEALTIIGRSLNRYSMDNICISFNGGKDCTALLHLVHSAVRERYKTHDCRITAFYAQLPNHFEEESKFVDDTVSRYNLTLLKYSRNSLKESLCQLKTDSPKTEAIFIGTRMDDLRRGVKMDLCEPTDKDWPSFMRINPILNWSYSQVWSFIREFDIPYCDLYNQGYSSLGTRNDTAKNSSLIKLSENGQTYYLPAWSLVRSQEERLSRSSSNKTTRE